MQSLASLTKSFSGTVPMSEDFYLFVFFWVGFFIFRSEAFRNHFCARRKEAASQARPGEASGHHSFLRLRDDFAHRRYENVLEGWAHLEKHSAEALALVVTSLLALGRPDDIGVFIAQTSASLPHLRPDLHQVVAAVAAPACEVRRQHILCALRDLHERAREVFDRDALKELSLALAKFNDEERVASLMVDLTQEAAAAEPEFLSKVVRSFLACQNLDASLGHLRKVLLAPSAAECPPHELIMDVIKMSTEAELADDSTISGVRPKAWEALDALKGVEITSVAALLFLEWSARQTPVDVAMAMSVEKLLRKAGPLPMDAYDALVKVHSSSAGDATKAFEYFDEFVQLADGSGPSETCLVGMISGCVEARNGTLAEHIFSWACAEDRCTLPIFSATVKVLAASKQAERICAIYQKIPVSSSTEMVLDEALCEQVASSAAQAGHVELARSMSKAPKKQHGQNPLSLMRACAQDGNVEQVMTLLQELQEEGDVDTVTFNCALDVCVSVGDADAAKTIIKEMKTSGHLDVASYNIMLKQCLSEAAPSKAAQDILVEMRQRGLEPNTATYNSLLSCAMTAADFAGVWQTLDDMERSGQSADIYTLSILFKGYKRERRQMDSESIDWALALIRHHSVKLDESLVNVILDACLSLRDVGCLKKALDTFWDSGWCIPKQASLHTYGGLIKAYGQIQSLTEVWQLWRELTVDKGVEASEQLYGQMLDALVSNDSLDDAIVLFQEMKVTHKATLNSQGFAVAYAMIIRGFAQQKDCDRALQCYEEMKTHGTRASLVVLNTLIDACSRVGDMSSASRLFNDMEESKITPDLITYSTLVKGHCTNQDLEQALFFFGAMQEKGIRPDAIVFNSLLDGCSKKQMPALCEQVIKDMEAAGVVPSNHSASILIKLYGRCKDLDAAFRVINEMPRKYGFRANTAVYTCLMSACIANNRLDQAMELRVRMVKEGMYPDDRTYSTLLRGALRACDVEHCTLLVHAALDQKGSRGRNLLEDDLLRSVLMLTQRQNKWETSGRELSDRLRSSGISVRMPLPPDSCSRSDGFGPQPQRYQQDAKRNSGNYRDNGAGRDARYQQQSQQQRRY